MGAEKTVTIKGDPIRKERTGAAVATLLPGMLVEVASTGVVQAHSTSGGNAQRAFALEDDLQGNDIDDAYASGVRVIYAVFGPGMEVNALLADGETAVVGSMVSSNGDGYLKVYTVASAEPDYVGAIVGIALEALDMSDSTGADPASQRLKIEVF
jgi:hypothetical protein